TVNTNTATGTTNGSTANPAPDEGTPAGHPQSVSGAFLACGYMESSSDVVSEAASGQETEIGCGAYQKVSTSTNYNTYAPVNVAPETMHPTVTCDDGGTYSLSMRVLSNEPLAIAVTITPDEIWCTLNMNVAAATLTRSIASITEFDAQDAFDVTKDANAMGTV